MCKITRWFFECNAWWREDVEEEMNDEEEEANPEPAATDEEITGPLCNLCERYRRETGETRIIWRTVISEL